MMIIIQKEWSISFIFIYLNPDPDCQLSYKVNEALYSRIITASSHVSIAQHLHLPAEDYTKHPGNHRDAIRVHKENVLSL